MADFYHVTFAFRLADFYTEIPSIGSQEENHSSQRSVTGILVLFTYFFIIFLFHARENYAASIKRDDVSTAFQLATFSSALSVCRLIVGRFAIATTQIPTSAEDRGLQLGPFAEATYYCYLSSRVNYLINFAFI